jgi:6-phosphogluconate dehydrogenase
MVHDGIECGIIAAFAEGLNILKHANAGKARQRGEDAPVREPEHYQYDFEVRDIAEVWRRGSFLSSRLLDQVAGGLAQDPALTRYPPEVPVFPPLRRALQAALDEGVPATVLGAALAQRFASRGEDVFACRVVQVMRRLFGEFGPAPA